jgi:hypothetical protein
MGTQEQAVGPDRVSDATFIVKGFQQLIVTNTVVGALTIPDGTEYAAMSVDDQNIRYRDDGNDPTVAIGLRMAAGLPAEVYPGPLADFRPIAEASTAKINISYRARI